MQGFGRWFLGKLCYTGLLGWICSSDRLIPHTKKLDMSVERTFFGSQNSWTDHLFKGLMANFHSSYNANLAADAGLAKASAPAANIRPVPKAACKSFSQWNLEL